MEVLKCTQWLADPSVTGLFLGLLISFYSTLFLWLYSLNLSCNAKSNPIVINKTCLKCQADAINIHNVANMTVNERWSRKINSNEDSEQKEYDTGNEDEKMADEEELQDENETYEDNNDDENQDDADEEDEEDQEDLDKDDDDDEDDEDDEDYEDDEGVKKELERKEKKSEHKEPHK